MLNLLNTLSQDLQNKLSQFEVMSVFYYAEYQEVEVKSVWSMDISYIEAIERELSSRGLEIA